VSEILHAQIARLIAENERLKLRQRWVIEYQTEIAGLKEQLADAQDKIDGFMAATAPVVKDQR
tara:strand:+ start:316 stop:504 length:189 start_codon:yes stop_codon:yes gene_type:complete